MNKVFEKYEEYKNLKQVVTIYIYRKERDFNYHFYRKKGMYWWKLFWLIPIFKYTLEEDCYIDEINGEVYYYPYYRIEYSDGTRYFSKKEKITFEEFDKKIKRLFEELEKAGVVLKKIEYEEEKEEFLEINNKIKIIGD